MKPIFNRTPLTPNTLAPLPLGTIRPEGWLKEQIALQLENITREYARICPERVGGAWVMEMDGDCTRQIYFLEGIIALGWTMDDEDLKARAKRSVEAILASQREDGWFGPAQNGDYWPLMLALRALRLYFTATGDKRVLMLMDRFFRYEYKNLADAPLCDLAVARGGENMELALWLYNITGQKYLPELCRRLRAQTLDWPGHFHAFDNVKPTDKTMRWERMREALAEEANEPLRGEFRPYFGTQYHYTNGVDIAMGLKTPGVINLFKSGFKEQGGFRFGWEKLMKHHGLPCGMFSCDNHLSGGNPCQGVQLQALVEMMNTLETLYGLGSFGEDVADILEKLAYNDLPAAFTPDMDAYQRVQQPNQVRLSCEERRWYNSGDDANLFQPARDDLDCASCHEAWPKFVSSLWYATRDGGVAAMSYAPCTLRTVLGGESVRLTVGGGYPFSQNVTIAIDAKNPAEFPIYLRIPFWARQSMICLPDGESMQVCAGESTCLRRIWKAGDVIRLEMPAVPRVSRWYHQSGAVEFGPLLMALPLTEKWAASPEGLCADTEDAWNRALVRDEPMKPIQVEEDISPFKHGEHAVGVMVRAAKVDWPMNGASCASVPMTPQLRREALDILELIPYGDTSLRVCCFPIGAVREPQKTPILK